MVKKIENKGWDFFHEAIGEYQGAWSKLKEIERLRSRFNNCTLRIMKLIEIRAPVRIVKGDFCQRTEIAQKIIAIGRYNKHRKSLHKAHRKFLLNQGAFAQYLSEDIFQFADHFSPNMVAVWNDMQNEGKDERQYEYAPVNTKDFFLPFCSATGKVYSFISNDGGNRLLLETLHAFGIIFSIWPPNPNFKVQNKGMDVENKVMLYDYDEQIFVNNFWYKSNYQITFGQFYHAIEESLLIQDVDRRDRCIRSITHSFIVNLLSCGRRTVSTVLSNLLNRFDINNFLDELGTNQFEVDDKYHDGSYYPWSG